MANRYAPAVEIPCLKAKLYALYRSAAGIDSHASFGWQFRSRENPSGISGKAVRYWIMGDGPRGPNRVPADRFDRFIEIFQRRLPGRRTRAETEDLLLHHDVTPLAEAFLAKTPEIAWVTSVLKADSSDVKMVDCGPSASFGVTARRRLLAGIEGRIDFPAGHWFRFELPERESRCWLTLIQWGQSGWFGLEADEEISIHWSGERMLIPSVRPYLLEEELGERRYLFLHSVTPLPRLLLSRLETSARACAPLDVDTLERLARLPEKSIGFQMTALNVSFLSPEEEEP